MNLKCTPQILQFDSQKWEEITPNPVNTLQVFITNKCNLRCKACFYAYKLGYEEIPFDEYRNIILKYRNLIKKVILMGGEPTLHKDINRMIAFNTLLGLKTTIYSNGINLKVLEHASLLRTDIRVGVYGVTKSERPITQLRDTNLPITITYMLRRDNADEMFEAARIAEQRFNCKGFFISSIRDIEKTQDFWEDTSETLSLKEYFDITQNFVRNYQGSLKYIHISRRGIIKPAHEKPENSLISCRFGNIFPDGKKIICPFDISRRIYTDKIEFNKQICDKCDECLLQKIVLKKLEPKTTGQPSLPLKKSRKQKPLPTIVDN
jgi:MoaA/NifB/PqqE/SkfB family radical SAM enzyme